MNETHTVIWTAVVAASTWLPLPATADLSPPDWAGYHGDRANAEGLVALRQGRHADALVAARRAVELTPDDASARYLLGVALIFDEQYDEAFAALRQVVTLAPDLAEAHHDLGLVAFYLGDADTAAQAFGQLAELRPLAWHGPYRQAQVAGMLASDWDACEAYLAEAVDRGFPHIASLPIDPEWGPVAEQAVFLEMVDRLLSSRTGGR